jgi:hypothetical protein
MYANACKLRPIAAHRKWQQRIVSIWKTDASTVGDRSIKLISLSNSGFALGLWPNKNTIAYVRDTYCTGAYQNSRVYAVLGLAA